MQELETIRSAYTAVKNRLEVIEREVLLELNQGLEGDFTAIAEAFESIAEVAGPAARAAWIVEYEAAESPAAV